MATWDVVVFLPEEEDTVEDTEAIVDEDIPLIRQPHRGLVGRQVVDAWFGNEWPGSGRTTQIFFFKNGGALIRVLGNGRTTY